MAIFQQNMHHFLSGTSALQCPIMKINEHFLAYLRYVGGGASPDALQTEGLLVAQENRGID